jgi:hypothetical protein
MSDARFMQSHQQKTDRLTPDSPKNQNPPDLTTKATIASFEFLAATVGTVRT